MSIAPTSTGIGAPGTAPAPANLGRSPMASQPGASGPSLIPFTRASSLATMQDYTGTIAAGVSQQIQLQTNAFLESLVVEFSMVATGNTATVAFALEGPFSVISSIKLDDPAGQSIIAPITGWQLYTLNKYLPDTDCYFDPVRDPGFSATASTGGTASNGGSFDFRLVIPIEHRRRDAFCTVNNSAANQRYLLTITTNSSYTNTTAGSSQLYTTAPTNAGVLTVTVFQQYWTSPPNAIVTSQGSVGTQQTPGGLGSVAFVRYERHNEVNGGGSPQVQLNNVGDYLSSIIFTLRSTSSGAPRDQADWPNPFFWWVNDFNVDALNLSDWQRWMARAYGLYGGVATTPVGNPGSLDTGVFVMWKMNAIFDKIENFAPANQYLPTDATTKLQVRGSTFGASANFLEVLTRTVRPLSGAALFGRAS